MPYADADKAREYQREYRRLQRAGTTPSTPLTTLPADFRLRKASDVLRLLEEQVEAVRADTSAGALEKARAVGYLASISLRAIEAGDLEARLEALEAVLKRRGEAA